ncbi:MAG TPA: hypothetical protein VGB78_09250 [Thermoplasmata archaeon]
MPVKFCHKCDTQLVRIEEEFNTDPTDYSMVCPKCDSESVSCPYCDAPATYTEASGKPQLVCVNSCWSIPLKVRKTKRRKAA